MTERQRIVEEILADPELRKRLVDALSDEIAEDPALSWHNRAVAILTGLSSAAVVLLAFLIPSAADLGDRYQAGSAIDRYAEIGRHLLAQAGTPPPSRPSIARSSSQSTGARISTTTRCARGSGAWTRPRVARLDSR